MKRKFLIMVALVFVFKDGLADEQGSSPRYVEARPLSPRTILIRWDPPRETNGMITGYKVFYTTRPNMATHSWQSQTVNNGSLTTINDLENQTIYNIRVQAFTSRGSGSLSAPVQVKTQPGVPSQPRNLRAFSSSPVIIQVSWSRPSDVGETVLGYELYWNDTFIQQQYQRSLPYVETYTLGELYPDSLYFVWVSARSRLGEGAATPLLPIRTQQYDVGETSEVKVAVLNSTSLRVTWKPPANKYGGLNRGYQIFVQELDNTGDWVNGPLKYDVADEDAKDYNVTGLQPDTEYCVEVSAVTRKGYSRCETAHTLGGVPTRPELTTKIRRYNKDLAVHVRWTRPSDTYGKLLGYRLKYGRLDSPHMKEIELAPQVDHTVIRQLDRAARYQLRLSGQNGKGWGQEAISLLDTPEGVPSASPMNISHRRQSPTTVVITWDPPLVQYRNGHILYYGYKFYKISDQYPVKKNSTQNRIVFSSLDENTEYLFRVKAFTLKGSGPWSTKVSVVTPGDVPPAPTNVQAMATSEWSVEVWWDPVPYFKDILGYQVLYTRTPVEDLDLWSSKRVPLTWSAEISGLDKHTMYAVRVAAFTDDNLGHLSELITVRVTPTDVPVQVRAHSVTTHTMTLSWRPPAKFDPVKYQISYGAHKEFYDNQGELQVLSIKPQMVLVEHHGTEYSINQLLPFTSYQVNITAVHPDGMLRPPAKITVTTDMAAPKPMVKPYSVGVEKDQIKVILPQASEEYGPIKYYFLVVVREALGIKDPDSYTIEDLTATAEDQVGPYIAGKFPRLSMPKEFLLGDQEKHHQFLNRRLNRNTRYKVFVRAVVDTPQQNLLTNSPFSDSLTLDQPTGVPPGYDHTDIPSVDRMDGSQYVIWIVVSAFVIVLVSTCVVAILIVKRRFYQGRPSGPAQRNLGP